MHPWEVEKLSTLENVANVLDIRTKSKKENILKDILFLNLFREVKPSCTGAAGSCHVKFPPFVLKPLL